jgi:hypothetical protein
VTTLTIKQAAEATGRDRRTIARRLAQGAYPGAYKDAAGVWQIPADALDLDAPTPGAALLEAPGPQAIEEIERLKAEVADLLRRAEVAEARAEERAQTIDALTVQMGDTLQALSTTLAAMQRERAIIEIEAPEVEGRRRRWGRRRR